MLYSSVARPTILRQYEILGIFILSLANQSRSADPRPSSASRARTTWTTNMLCHHGGLLPRIRVR